MQHLLAGPVWDHNGVRDDVRDYLVDRLGDPAAVLVVDETGDCKKGAAMVGVQRQDTGTAGKVDNAQVAVYLTEATGAGHRVIDRELYLPKGWIDDPVRCRAAGVPLKRGFATKPELARMMLERALDARVPAGCVTADEVYGGSPALRGWLETRAMPLGAGRQAHRAAAPAVRAAHARGPAGRARPVGGLAAHQRRAGCQAPPPICMEPGAGHRRRAPRVGALAAGPPQPDHRGNWRSTCAPPPGLPLVALVRVAGTRWRVEEAFQPGKRLCGLDEHQVRRWGSWYRWVTLAMLAHAFQGVAALTEHARHPPPLGLIHLTCNEIQRLFAVLVAAPVADTSHRVCWTGGHAGTRPALAPAAASGKPTDREDHELQLEY